MDNSIPEQKAKILNILEKNPKGLSRGEITKLLSFTVNYKTLQRRLSSLVEEGKIKRTGIRKTARYWSLNTSFEEDKGQIDPKSWEIFSKSSKNVLKFLDSPSHFREQVSYKREFIESYVPNETTYVPINVRQSLFQKGKRLGGNLVAGTYVQSIYQRLLIDLSFNSSRLEGNTYSRLDAQKLLEVGLLADEKITEESVMILNHKRAISFLIENAEEIDFNTFTLFNLHSLLSQDLIANPEARGKIRQNIVSIGQSTYHPIINGHLLRELFELILLKARSIQDPFEQSFFVLVHLSYLQAFEDVNKRTSRLSCNIPFIKHNLCPLSFIDVPRDEYIRAHLAIYEKTAIKPLLDLFCWAYFRSCQQYSVMTEAGVNLDPYRIKTRSQREEIMGWVIRKGLRGEQIEVFILSFCETNSILEPDKFLAQTLTELNLLHEGSIVGLGVSVEQFYSWANSQTAN